MRSTLQRLNTDVREWLESTSHEIGNFDWLESSYVHEFYGGRTDAANLATITAGQDTIRGDEGSDFLLGDSNSLYNEIVVASNGTSTLSAIDDVWSELQQEKLETKFLRRYDYEHTDYYQISNTENLLDKDQLF